jgi:20S proteasome alpha/beta subunit
LSADARAFANKARSESKQYKSFYDHPIPGKMFSDRMSLFAQVIKQQKWKHNNPNQ